MLQGRWPPAKRPCAAPPYVAGVSLFATLAPKVVGTQGRLVGGWRFAVSGAGGKVGFRCRDLF